MSLTSSPNAICKRIGWKFKTPRSNSHYRPNWRIGEINKIMWKNTWKLTMAFWDGKAIGGVSWNWVAQNLQRQFFRHKFNNPSFFSPYISEISKNTNFTKMGKMKGCWCILSCTDLSVCREREMATGKRVCCGFLRIRKRRTSGDLAQGTTNSGFRHVCDSYSSTVSFDIFFYSTLALFLKIIYRFYK